VQWNDSQGTGSNKQFLSRKDAIMKSITLILGALLATGLCACSSMPQGNDPALAQASGDSATTSKPTPKPWSYHSYPFGE
jgi:hypothetical protein